jgi:phytoene dehydrogenase-like protein
MSMTSADDRPATEGPREEAYDVVVIGAGIGGLTAGALIARAGRRVLVVEAESEPGGYTRSLSQGPYTFDRADHLINGAGPEGPFGPGVVYSVLRHLGAHDRCEFIRVDNPIYRASFPGFSQAVPHGREAYLEAHLSQFPSEARGLRTLLDLSASIYREWLAFPMKPGILDLLGAPRRFPSLFRYRNATLGEVVDRELSDPRLKATYAALGAWLGLPPAQASFIGWSVMMAGYVEEGAFYCRGSFQTLADAFAFGLRESGGELLLGTRATRILAERGRVKGVELEGGRQVAAPLVLSNIDTRKTFQRMLPADLVPGRYLRRMTRMKVSADIAALYLATDLDVRGLGAEFDTIVYEGWDLDEALGAPRGGRVKAVDVMIPTLVDPSLAPPGEHLAIVQALLPRGTSESLHDERGLAERMLELAEYVLPGLGGRITGAGRVDAGQKERLLLNKHEAIYGWENSPGQAGRRRPTQHTPVKGLVLVGQWTQPGGGIIAVVASGIQAARLALGAPTSQPPLPLGLPVSGPARPSS